MISAVTLDWGAGRETLRMTTRAMIEAEESLDAGIVEICASLETDFRVGKAAKLLAACGNDGQGLPFDRALEICDAAGLELVLDRIGAALEAAFPQAAGDGGKKTKAGRSK